MIFTVWATGVLGFFPEPWSPLERNWWWTLPNWATRCYRNCCLRLIFPFLHTLWRCKMMTARVLTVSDYLCPLFALVMEDGTARVLTVSDYLCPLFALVMEDGIARVLTVSDYLCPLFALVMEDGIARVLTESVSKIVFLGTARWQRQKCNIFAIVVFCGFRSASLPSFCIVVLGQSFCHHCVLQFRSVFGHPVCHHCVYSFRSARLWGAFHL